MRVSFDWNVIISLEKREKDFHASEQIVHLHKSGKLKICISDIHASERPRKGAELADESGLAPYRLFPERLQKIGLEDAEFLKPLAFTGLAFVGRSVVGSETYDLHKRIYSVLFPESTYEEFERSRLMAPSAVKFGQWQNKMCDVLSMWSHIHYNCDIFITEDENFLRSKKPALLNLGAKEILCPSDALDFLKSLP